MSVPIRVILVLVSACTWFAVLKKIRSAKVQIEYAIFWILFSIALLAIAIFPAPVLWMSDLLGFQSPINMIFLIMIFVLILRLFHLNLQISQMEYRLRELVQELSLEKQREIQEKKEKNS